MLQLLNGDHAMLTNLSPSNVLEASDANRCGKSTHSDYRGMFGSYWIRRLHTVRLLGTNPYFRSSVLTLTFRR